jgi:hypothetical protein
MHRSIMAGHNRSKTLSFQLRCVRKTTSFVAVADDPRAPLKITIFRHGEV